MPFSGEAVCVCVCVGVGVGVRVRVRVHVRVCVWRGGDPIYYLLWLIFWFVITKLSITTFSQNKNQTKHLVR